MDLLPIAPKTLRIGQVLTFSIRDAEGKLLYASGHTLQDTPVVRGLIEQGAWALAHETQVFHRALAHKVDTMMLQGAMLGDIAKAKADFIAPESGGLLKPERRGPANELEAWTDLQQQAHTLMREPKPGEFLPRFEALHAAVLQQMSSSADSLLTLLVYDVSHDFQRYSAKHGLLCMALAELCARRLGWSDEWRGALTRAGLSLNARISVAQDRLAASSESFTENQRLQLRHLSSLNPTFLRQLGVGNELWLNALSLRHETRPGPLAGRSAPEQLARLLSRIDIFGARISPRRTRQALSAASASRAVFLNENQQPDEAGAALVKAVGLYLPGSLVALANGEVGIVFKRGHSANEPMVATLLGKSGNPMADPVPRDTRLPAQAVARSIAPHEMKLHVNLEKLQRLYRLV